MLTLTVEQAQDKENMKKKEIKGYVADFPETPTELVEVITLLTDEQALTCLSLLKTQTLVFLRPRLHNGEKINFTKALELEKRSSLGAAVKSVEESIFKIIGSKNPDMVQVQVLLQKKALLEEKQEITRVKRAAKKAAEKAEKDAPKIKNS